MLAPRRGTVVNISIYLSKALFSVFTAQEIDDGVIYTARSDGIRGLKYLYSDRFEEGRKGEVTLHSDRISILHVIKMDSMSLKIISPSEKGKIIKE